MNKSQSERIKGIAILLMLFLHLFNVLPITESCRNYILINDVPLAYILTKAANPIAFFLILGGYGLYKVYIKGDKHRWLRLIKLYIHYWIILIICLTIGHYLKPDIYPGNLTKIISNFTGYDSSYCGEMWFLLPYVVLSALSPYLFYITRNIRPIIIITTTLFIHLFTSYCISRYGSEWLFATRWLYDPLCVLHMLFNFMLGAVAARTNFFDKFNNWFKNLTTSHSIIKNPQFILLGGGNLLSINCLRF